MGLKSKGARFGPRLHASDTNKVIVMMLPGKVGYLLLRAGFLPFWMGLILLLVRDSEMYATTGWWLFVLGAIALASGLPLMLQDSEAHLTMGRVLLFFVWDPWWAAGGRARVASTLYFCGVFLLVGLVIERASPYHVTTLLGVLLAVFAAIAVLAGVLLFLSAPEQPRAQTG